MASKDCGKEEASWVLSATDANSSALTWSTLPSDDIDKRLTRDMNKKLRIIYEDEEIEYGSDTDGEELQNRRMVASTLAENTTTRALQDIKKSKIVDLCFLIDITGSMDEHIAGVRDWIGKIVNFLCGSPGMQARDSRLTSLRLALVGYRDISDKELFKILPFTSNTDEFRSFCAAIKADGGGDGAEDVFGGIQNALALDWNPNSGTRVIFHLADAPCHGREFHEGVTTDDYEDGDFRGIKVDELFATMREKLINYFFGTIVSRQTDLMIRKFSEAYGETIVEFDVKNPTKIFYSVTTAVNVAVIRSMEESRKGVRGKRLRKYVIYKQLPNWTTVRQEIGTYMIYELPKSIQDILDNLPLPRRSFNGIRIKIASNPFAEGTERIAYYGRDETMHKNPASSKEEMRRNVVLKEFKHINRGDNSAARYEMTNETQSVAMFFARKFQALHGAPVTVKFLKIKTLAVTGLSGSKRFMSVEKLLDDANFERFSNNHDYAMSVSKARAKGIREEDVELLAAFTHWTYDESRGEMMIVDLQGIISKDGKKREVILLTDPAIHCTDITRFRPMNLGKDGMRSFFAHHVCNSFCRKLQLRKPERL